MKNSIREHLNNTVELEKLYRSDKEEFAQSFFELYPEIESSQIAKFWNARLQIDHTIIQPDLHNKRKLWILLLTCLVSGFCIKWPQILDVDVDSFLYFERNTGLIVFLGLSVFAFLTREYSVKKPYLLSALAFIVTFIYVNLLPGDESSDTIVMAFVHIPLMMWCMYGLIFIDFKMKHHDKTIAYIKYNGDLVIMMALLLIAGGLMTGITLGLFSAIEVNIEEFYLDYVVIWGLMSAPLVATYIIEKYPSVTNKLAPIIANIFSPLVLITLVVYLISILFAGKDPYNDRDFLIIFNIMVLGVLAIIVFSISETSDNSKHKFNNLTLFALSIVTLIINFVALSAIIYRLNEYGFTPNRTVVLGSNVLIFGNLLLIMYDLYKVNFKGANRTLVEHTISKYLPYYFAWTVFIVYILPLIFSYQ